MTPRPIRRGARTRLPALVVSSLLLTGAVLAASPATADPAMDANAQAAALSAKIESLQNRAEIASERYDATNDQLSNVVGQMISASARVDALNHLSDDSQVEATRRISAIYRSGGGLSLYATVLDGSSPDDMVTRIRTVQSLVDDDYEQNSSLRNQIDEATSTKVALRTLASHRTDLERTARESKDEVDSLIAQTQTALDSANATIVRLANEQTQQRESSDEAAARAVIGNNTAPGNPYAAAAMAFAASKIGLPYVWGGTGPNGYDCSGLMQAAYGSAGLQIPRVAAAQYNVGPPVALSAIAPGDLVFWATDPARKSTIHHVAMYVGGGKMIEAPHTGAFVRLVPLRLGAEFAGAVRPGLPAGAR